MLPRDTKWGTHSALVRCRLSDSWNRTDTCLPRMRLTTVSHLQPRYVSLPSAVTSNEDVYSPMKAAQQEHKHTDRDTNVKDRQKTELSKDIHTFMRLKSLAY